MKPHSLRKTLWFANVVLGLCVVGLAVWFLVTVRPAVAKETQREAKYRPPDLEKLRKGYESERATGLKWQPKPPVSEDDLNKYVLRPDYEKKDPKHWIFSGPMPPTKDASAPTAGPVEAKPTGLETQGSVVTIYYAPPNDTVVLFAFTGGGGTGGAGKGGGISRAFGIGDPVRRRHSDPVRYRITDVKEVAPKLYEVAYEVYGSDKTKSEFKGVMTYGKGADTSDWPNWLRPVEPVDPAPAPGAAEAATVPPGTVPAGAPDGGPDGALASAGDGTTPADAEAEAGEAPAGDPAADGEDGADEPTVVEVVRKPVEELAVEDLQPEIEYNPENRDERALKVDDNTYRWLKGKNAKSIAKTVKTEVAYDKRTKQPVGIRITGLKEGSAAGAFQVKKGDVLVSINGRKVTSKDEAIRIVEGLNPDNIVTVVIERHGKLLTYKVDPRDPKTRRQVRYFENLK